MGKKIFKRALVDPVIKYSTLGILYIAAIIAMVFALISLTVRTGAQLGESYTTSVYITPYNVDLSKQKNPIFFFDQTKQPYVNPTNATVDQNYIMDLNSPSKSAVNWILPGENELDNKLKAIIDAYASRLSVLNYQQPVISSKVQANINDTNPNNSYLNNSWLNNKTTALGLTITVGKPNITLENKKDGVDYSFIINQYVNDQLSLSNQLSLETTDGVIVFSNDDITKNTISSNTNTVGLNRSNSYVNFELRNNQENTWNVLSDIADLVINDDPNKPLNNSLLMNSSFNTKRWTGVNDTNSLTNLIPVNDDTPDKPYGGDRTLILWNSKYAALNYVRRIFSYYKAYATPGNSTTGSIDYLNSHLTPLEQTFGEFLFEPKKDASYASMLPKNDATGELKWTGFKDEKDITENLLGYFCFKPSSSVNASAITLTDFAPLFSKYIVSYFRAQTGVKKENAGISWTNTDDFKNFFKKPSSPVDKAKIQINKRYAPKFPENILSPTAELTDLTAATANKLAKELQSAFPDNTYVIWNDFKLPEVNPTPASNLNNQVITPVTQKSVKQLDTTVFAPLAQSVDTSSASKISPAALIGISLGVIFILLAIFMGVIYRIGGLMSWFGMMFGLAVTFFLFFQFSGVFSIASALGLLVVGMLSIFSWIHTFELFRRNLKQMIPVFTSFRLALRQAVMPVVDMHIILFLFALPLLFLGKYSEQSFSVIILVGSFLSFFISYLFSLITIRLFLSNRSWKNTKLLIMGNYRLDSMNASETTSQTSFSHLPSQTSNKGFSKCWIWLLMLFVATAILPIVGYAFSVKHDLTIANFAGILISNGVISLSFSAVIGLIYLFFRYRWIIILPFCFSCLFTTFVLFGSPYVLLLPTDSINQDDVIVLMSLYLLSILFFISSADLQRRFFNNKVVYSDEEFRQHARLSLKNRIYPQVILYAFVLVTFNPLFIFGASGGYQFSNSTANEILLFNIALVLILLANFYLIPYILLSMIYLRNKAIKKHTKHDGQATHGEHEWTSISYDPNDEQLIVGINSRQ